MEEKFKVNVKKKKEQKYYQRINTKGKSKYYIISLIKKLLHKTNAIKNTYLNEGLQRIVLLKSKKI